MMCIRVPNIPRSPEMARLPSQGQRMLVESSLGPADTKITTCGSTVIIFP